VHGGVSLGHFYMDISKREFSIQFKVTLLKMKREVVQELLIPLRVLILVGLVATTIPPREHGT